VHPTVHGFPTAASAGKEKAVSSVDPMEIDREDVGNHRLELENDRRPGGIFDTWKAGT